MQIYMYIYVSYLWLNHKRIKQMRNWKRTFSKKPKIKLRSDSFELKELHIKLDFANSLNHSEKVKCFLCPKHYPIFLREGIFFIDPESIPGRLETALHFHFIVSLDYHKKNFRISKGSTTLKLNK